MMIRLSLVIILCLLPTYVRAADAGATGRLHPPTEFIKIVEESSFAYHISGLQSPVPPLPSGRVLAPQLYIDKTNGQPEIKKYQLSGPAHDAMIAAEAAFAVKNYDEAIKGYKAVKQLAPSYAYALSMLGDAYYSKGDYATAKGYFEEAIKENYIDYHAHWFLADTLWALGDRQRAVEELAIAHILNFYHPEIIKKLKHYKQETMGRSWSDWVFTPQYLLTPKADGVDVSVADDWIGYALVKAVWKYEPGYAEKRIGAGYKDRAICIEEELEALMALFTKPESFPHIRKIISEGFGNEFVVYEILARRSPSSIPLLPKEVIQRMAAYVIRFH